jgi:hypothetical protein
MRSPEIRFKPGDELYSKILELQSLGHFDSQHAAAKSALGSTIDNVISAYRMLGSGQAIAQAQPSPSQPQNLVTPAQQTFEQQPKPMPEVGKAANSLDNLFNLTQGAA